MSTVTLDQLEQELDKRWYQRRSPLLHTTFRAQHDQALRDEIGRACQLVGLLYVAFGALDAILIRDVLPYVLALRLVVGAAYVGAIVAQVRRGVDTRVLEFECSLGIYIGFVAWLYVASQSSDVTAILYYAGYGLIFMFVANLFFDLSFRFALLSSGLIAATFLFWSVQFGGSKTYIVCFGSLYVLSLILTAFLNFKYNRERYRVHLNACRAEVQRQAALQRGEELFRLSTTDALTGLANRRAIDGVLQELWLHAVNSGQAFGVVLIDVDFFKLYNDRYGHQQGDRCLATLGRAMRNVADRWGCALGRFGGEEFAALIRAGSAEQVRAFAEEVRQAVDGLRIPHAARRDRLRTVTVSIGAAFSADVAGDKPERAVTAADVALYVAKDDGRDRVRIFDTRMLDDGAGDNLNGEILRSALSDGRISAAFQPIVDVSSGRVWAAEALMRLRGPEGRAISPDTFIPVAERTGAILEMGAWILREACDVLASEPTLPVVSVNVSAKQIEDPNFISVVESAVQAAGIAPSRLALEITESGEISGNPEVAKLIDHLTAAGIRVWLDDFGTGFAGLTCLSELRFDMVKIDRFFVQSCETPRGAKLLKNIIDLVDNCAQRTIVEGVEEARQIELISSFGVDLFQGYHLGRPMPRQELSRRLTDTPAKATPVERQI
ncbi:putative bifunctional diguanylate cyclase/phosphodiesterase [Methylobacterium brachiatum]|jgi:diguanylate cyclase (GGDEF)-like protein|uniref:putative bifunctional diguanylate cyclase/phosphodiesterase n=1 Tax=Methylobacterium brachiatum TaxID=269660 RepID=UPI002448DAB0|nr:GGDEF domain-containing phosphodiesterase [Methylobacterium brachiatum]MDH2313859.1 EAL domain-containing protein [Methylobacterium brachiatum]